MGIYYDQAPDEAREILQEIMAAHHPALMQADLRVDIVFAHNKNGPAVKLNGYECAAVVRIVNLKDRVMGRGDAEIVVDGDKWGDWSDGRRRALIDHELTHLVVKTTEDGTIDFDDAGRPKLKMRQHDVQVGWFVEVASRHGEESFEVEQAANIAKKYGQYLLPFAEPVVTGKYHP